VNDNGPAVRAGLNVDLDRKAVPNRAVNRGQRIFRMAFIVEAAMGDRRTNKPFWNGHG
jgi:hypothetical protein